LGDPDVVGGMISVLEAINGVGKYVLDIFFADLDAASSKNHFDGCERLAVNGRKKMRTGGRRR
jgi:hypothetical protein